MLTKAEGQHLRSLREKSHREAAGRFVIEGEKVVRELTGAGWLFEEIYATEAWTGARTRTLTAEEMARASHYPTPSSVLAVGRIERRPLPDQGLASGLTLALDGVQDPGNVGTLLRIADWFALDRVVLSPDCADLFSQKVINASMGSFARVAVHTLPLAEVLAGLAGATPVLGCDLRGEDVHTLRPVRDAVIVIGSEGRGLSEGVKRHITQFVTIPRYGRAESLNAGVAAAIVCDNLRRARPD
ncbi:MAG: TrmH family RNA methyltransferase [Opitutales bacterium]